LKPNLDRSHTGPLWGERKKKKKNLRVISREKNRPREQPSQQKKKEETRDFKSYELHTEITEGGGLKFGTTDNSVKGVGTRSKREGTTTKGYSLHEGKIRGMGEEWRGGGPCGLVALRGVVGFRGGETPGERVGEK